MEFTEIEAIYRRHIRRRDLRPGTIIHRIGHLRRLDDWMKPNGLLDASREDVEAFLDNRDIVATTRYAYLSDYHSFFQWAIDEGFAGADPTMRIIRPKLRPRLPRPISDEDLSFALRAAENEPEISAWFHLAALGGLRCCEIAGLDARDIDFSTGHTRVMGKGRKERIVPLHPAVATALRRAGIPTKGALFMRPRGGRYPAWALCHKGNRFLHDIGLTATMHTLRHWFGTHTYEACADLRVVQELMGHADPSTTAVYVAWSQTRGRAAIEALSIA